VYFQKVFRVFFKECLPENTFTKRSSNIFWHGSFTPMCLHLLHYEYVFIVYCNTTLLLTNFFFSFLLVLIQIDSNIFVLNCMNTLLRFWILQFWWKIRVYRSWLCLI